MKEKVKYLERNYEKKILYVHDKVEGYIYWMVEIPLEKWTIENILFQK